MIYLFKLPFTDDLSIKTSIHRWFSELENLHSGDFPAMFDDTRQVKWCNEKTGTEQVPPPKLYSNPGSNIVHLTIRKGQMAETFIDLGEKQQESQTTFLVNPRRRFHRVFNFQFRDLEPLQVDIFFCCFT